MLKGTLIFTVCINYIKVKSHSHVYKQTMGVKCPIKCIVNGAFCSGCYCLAWLLLNVSINKSAELISQIHVKLHNLEAYLVCKSRMLFVKLTEWTGLFLMMCVIVIFKQ